MVELMGIQEMLQKTEPQRKLIERIMDSESAYDFDLANLYTLEGGERIGEEDEARIRESLRKIPLRSFFGKGKIKEFMASSGTTGLSGARYLIPDKIHTTIYDFSAQRDIVPAISAQIITDIPGQSLKVDIGIDGSYKAKEFSSAGKIPDDEIAVTQATITPISFGIALRITNDMLEDTPNIDLIDWHLRQAALELGDKASNMAINVLYTGTDGDGTINTVTAQADETTTTSLMSAIKQIVTDEWDPDTLLTTPEAWLHSITQPHSASSGMYSMTYAKDFYDTNITTPIGGWQTAGPRTKIFGIDTIFSCDTKLFTAASGYMTDCKSLLFDQSQALLTGRKRWARIERYSDPVRDLVGAVISARQDSVTVFNDAICRISES